jgi:glycosyltransferase involved in cell wall biosynthesis
MAAMLTNVDLVFTEHGRLSDAEPSLKRRLVNPFLSLMRGRLCSVSSDLKQFMVAEGFQARRVQVVYNGIDPGHRPVKGERRAAREILGLPLDAFVVGTVGRLDLVKNLTLFLKAHALLLSRHSHARAVIIGEGPERAGLESSAAALDIRSSVVFAGYRANVRELLPAFDVYLNCSAYEGVSLTILEAMAATLPVVATPVGGNPEVVVDGETGLITAARAHAIADALGTLARDPRRRQAMGDAGRWRVIRKFSIARMVDDYATAYLGRSSTTTAAPASEPTAADAMSVSEPTRSTV